MTELPIDPTTRDHLESVQRAARRTGFDLFEALNKNALLLTSDTRAAVRSRGLWDAIAVLDKMTGQELMGPAYTAGHHSVWDIKQAFIRQLALLAKDMRSGRF